MKETPMICVSCKHKFIGNLTMEEFICPLCGNSAVFDNSSYVPSRPEYTEHHLNSPFFAPIEWLLHHHPHLYHRK